MYKLLTSICLLVAVKGYAQNPYFFSKDDNNSKTFYAGLTAGGNFCRMEGDGYEGYKKVGFVGGATVYAQLLRKVNANIELLYSHKGSRGVARKTSIYSGDFFEQYWLDLDYIEVPIIVHYAFKPRWEVGVGVSYASLLSFKEEIYSDQPLQSNPDIHFFKNTDVNYIISGSLHLGNGWFLVGRYQRSTSTIRDAANIPVWQNSFRQLNDLFSLRLQYLIN